MRATHAARILLGALAVGYAPAQELETIELRPNFHVIAGAGGNISVQSGPDGVVVVDTGSGQMAEKALAAIQRLSSRPLRYIINTSADPGSVGGNEKIAATGKSFTPANRSLDF